jgi:hypothetical protein
MSVLAAPLEKIFKRSLNESLLDEVTMDHIDATMKATEIGIL